MRCTFLGTGTSQGVPVIACDCSTCSSKDPRDHRLRSSVHIEVDDLHIVIDTGPDFRQQMLRASIHRLDAVLFTHQHKDHTAGLDDIRSFTFKQKKHMPLYGRAEVLDQITREFSYIFDTQNTHPGIPKATLHPITSASFSIKEAIIQPIEVLHHRLPVFGFRIRDFSYITDANYISKAEQEKIKGSKVLVLDALRKEPHPSHFTLSEAIALAEELQVPQTYFTHISHLLGRHEEVSSELPPGTALAYDGLQLVF